MFSEFFVAHGAFKGHCVRVRTAKIVAVVEYTALEDPDKGRERCALGVESQEGPIIIWGNYKDVSAIIETHLRVEQTRAAEIRKAVGG